MLVVWGEVEVLALVADGVGDVVPLALAHEGQGAPAAVEDGILQVPSCGLGQRVEVQGWGEEFGTEKPLAGAFIGAAEGEADEPAVEDWVGELLGELERGPW